MNVIRRRYAIDSVSPLKLLLVLVLGLGFFIYGCSSPPPENKQVEVLTPSPERDPATVPAALQNLDYSEFKHSNESHTRLPCLLCHIRAEGLTTPKMPGHMPCAGCHVQQFADTKSQMCSICHTDAVTGTVKSFPPLRSFNVRFDHGRHLRQTNCGACHKPTQAGVALSIPSGRGAHASCFQCHGPRTEIEGRNIGSCGVCHEPGRLVRSSQQSKAFRFNFSHGEHVGKMSCSSCHTVRAGAARSRQVSSPLTVMHSARPASQSCGNCHNSKRAFGISDFTNCKRCHEGKTFQF